MDSRIREILAKIQTLQDDLEKEYREARALFEAKKIKLAENFLSQQQRYKINLVRFVFESRILVVLTAPVIYAGWIPFILLDIFVSVYQLICFPVYGIPKVKRGDYVFFDREDLPYLNLIEKFNCFYCSYGNGVVAYAREIAGRTEQYWCPIKHARKLKGAHERYPNFFDYGDAEAYRSGLERLRKQYEREEKLIE